MAAAAPNGAIEDAEDIGLGSCGVPIPLFNAVQPLRPPTDVRELESWLRRAGAFFRRQDLPWMLTLPKAWIPSDGGQAIATLGGHEAIQNTGMFTDQLIAPMRPPALCDIRPLSGSEAAAAMAHVNTVAYGMRPEEEIAMIIPRLWAPPVFGYGVFEEDRVVSVGAIRMQNGAAYVMWMATLPEARKRGYAEAIMRRALADQGNPPTVLHASGMGRPLYAQMGYQAAGEFPGFVFT